MSDAIIRTAIPCACVGACGALILVDYEPWQDDPRMLLLEIGITYRDDGLRSRLKAAWGVLRRKDPWFHGVCLYDDGIQKLREALR